MLTGINVKMTPLLTALFLFIPSAATAADWRYFPSDPEQSVELYDATSIDRTNSINEVWFEIAYFGNRLDKVFNKTKLFRFNCSAKRLSLLESFSYDFTGKIIDSLRIPAGEIEENRIVLDSRGELRFNNLGGNPSSNEAIPVRSASEAAKIYRNIRRSFPFENGVDPFAISLFLTKEACELNGLENTNPQKAAAICKALD